MPRSFHPHANLDVLKKQAKELLAAHKAGDPSCCATLRALHSFAGKSEAEILATSVKLTEVQFALAVDYGFKSWKDLSMRVVPDGQAGETDRAGLTPELLDWCTSRLGSVEYVPDGNSSEVPEEPTVFRLRTDHGLCYLKVPKDASYWGAEVHAYENWAVALGGSAPRLLAVREEDPRAFILSEIAGRPLEGAHLSAPQERSVWRAAGHALAGLHDHAVGKFFGPCNRDGTCDGTPIFDATDWVGTELETEIERGLKTECLTDDEVIIVKAALALVPSFDGERPVPCHRDYQPGNWLVSSNGVWAGVIDFQFSQWNIRATDYARYPDWNWIDRPDLAEAFFGGYGRAFTRIEEEQRLVAHTRYALNALVWGSNHSMHGFAEDGRKALKHIGRLLG